MNTTTVHRALTRAALGAAAVCLLAAPLAAEPAFEIATMNAGATGIVWQPTFAVDRMVLTVSGPDGIVRHEFDGSTNPTLGLYDAEGYPLADGAYTWELRAVPALSSELKADLAAARASGDMTQVEGLRRDGYLPNQPLAQSGYFRIEGGAFVGDAEEPAAPLSQTGQVASGGQAVRSTTAALEYFAEDVAIDGSLCVGGDCTTTEDFGFDTIRLKENNLRIKFLDTSTGAFPSVDWQLTANDSNSGGANRFSIEDVTNTKTPFTVEANAPNHSLYVDDGGRVGVGTSAPAMEVDVVDGDTPALRLQQDGSGGFTPQIWDVAGNETNFFIRDVTNGSDLPFRIEPGTAENMLYLDSNDRVGIGTNSPSDMLHVRSTTGTASILVEEASGTVGTRTPMTVRNNGQTRFVIHNTNATVPGAGGYFFAQFDNGRFVIRPNGGGAGFFMDDSGNITAEADLTVNGTFSNPSSRTLKENFRPLDPQQILARFVELPIAEWSYKGEQMRHIGPFTEDFQAAFGLGTKGTHIIPLDVQGVTMAALQGLHQVVEEKDAALEELKGENAELAARLAALEALVSTLVSR